MRPSFGNLLPFLLVALCAPGCIDLADISTGVCGNGVLEAGEDCDRAKDGDGKGTCGQAPADGDRACRFKCKRDGSVACPTDETWVCGVDEVCRRPADPPAWKPGALIAGGRAEDLLAGDLNADGITDLITVAPPTVAVQYFALDGQPTLGDSFVVGQSPHATIANFGGRPAPPTDGVVAETIVRMGMAMSYSRGLGVFLGSSGESAPAPLTPVAYAVVSVPDPKQEERFGAFLQRKGADPNTWMSGTFSYDTQSLRIVRPNVAVPEILPFGAGATRIGEGHVARFLDRPCEQIALPLQVDGVSHVRVWAPCAANGENAAEVVADITLPGVAKLCRDDGTEDSPAGAGRCRPLHLVDIDRNGWPDLVLVDDQFRLHLAFSDGKNFLPAADAPSPTPPVVDAVASGKHGPDIADQRPPIAIADLNGDCALDVVDATHIFMSDFQGDPACPAAGANVPSTHFDIAKLDVAHFWTEAVVTDMNHDGLPDLVGGSMFDAGLTLYTGTSSSLMNPFPIVTENRTSHLTAGDFDGDGVSDIAFVEIGHRGGDQTAVPDTLSMAFGAASAAPTTPVQVAELGQVAQVIASHQIEVSGDVVEDLIVAARGTSGDGATTEVYLFPGSSTRRIMAPYFVATTGAAEYEAVQRSIVGWFSGASTPDVVACGRPLSCIAPGQDCKVSLWLLPTMGDGWIPPQGADGQGVAKETPLETEKLMAPDALLGNLGADTADGRERIALAAADTLGAVHVIAVWVGDDGLLTYGDTTEISAIPGFTVASSLELSAQMRTADVDGDGHLDVVLTSPGVGVAFVLWDAAKGKLDAAGAKVVSTDTLGKQCPIQSAAKKDVLSATAERPIESGDLRPTPILVVDQENVYRVTWIDGAPKPECASDFKGGHAVATGDFNGDGLDDIAVSTSGGVQIYLAAAAPAKGDPAPDTTGVTPAVGAPQ